MQGAFARLCVVVAAAIFNPLLFPHENSTLPDQDDQLLARMKEHEERLAKEQAKLDKEISQLEITQESHSEPDYSWYFWSAVSFVIFLTIELGRWSLSDSEFFPIEDENESETKAMVLSKDILQNFCDRCTLTHENGRLKEFVEGFADDLLEAHRDISDTGVDIEVSDFVGVGSMFESWQVCKPLTCDLLVPFTLPDPYRFQFCLSDIPPNMQGSGVIQLSRLGDECCICCSANLGEDMICLLHPSNNNLKPDRSAEELLCSKNTNLLSKHQVMKWFQISITKAWSRISHKYDFELTFRNLDAAGAFKLRLPSGKVIVLNLIPAVQLDDSDAFFITHFPSNCDVIQEDPYWPLSVAVHEKKMLKYFTKRLPQNSCHLHCLQIVSFLHCKQTSLTGKSALTSYHFKTVLFHLLINKPPDMWTIDKIDQRLRDVLNFMQRSLQEKRLIHSLVGNYKIPKEIQIPNVILTADPINLFRCLVLDRTLHEGTLTHFQEMLRNAPALLQEYTPVMTNGGAHLRLNEIL